MLKLQFDQYPQFTEEYLKIRRKSLTPLNPWEFDLIGFRAWLGEQGCVLKRETVEVLTGPESVMEESRLFFIFERNEDAMFFLLRWE